MKKKLASVGKDYDITSFSDLNEGYNRNRYPIEQLASQLSMRSLIDMMNSIEDIPFQLPVTDSNVIPFTRIHKQDRKCLELIERIRDSLYAGGYLIAPDGSVYIRQGCKPNPALSGSIDLNRYHTFINHQLIEEGWVPFSEMGMDENFLLKRKELLDAVGWKEVREERSVYRVGEFPAMVFYGKRK